jgi:hypothetical protein
MQKVISDIRMEEAAIKKIRTLRLIRGQLRLNSAETGA